MSPIHADDLAAMQAFLRFCEPRRAAIASRITAAVAAPAIRDRLAQHLEELRALQHQAVFEDRWEPCLASLRTLAEASARAGVTYATWFGMLRAYRASVREELAAGGGAPATDPSTALAIAHGMDLLLELAIERIGDVYLGASQERAGASEDRSRALFERSPLPMWMYDRATLRFVTVNDAAVRHYGYTREELAAMTIAEIRPAEDLSALHADVEHAVGPSERRTWRHRRKDGTIITVEIAANDFVSDGRAVRLVSITDVTERVAAEQALKRTEDQLRHAQKMDAIGRLAGGVAHDFNNVLTVISSYAGMLDETMEAGDPRHDDVREIRRAAERAAGMTRQLLTLSRQSIVAPRALDLDVVIDEFLPMLRRLLGETIAIVTRPGGVPPVVADPGQIEQVLMNLAINARDAMPKGGRLTIESRTTALDAESAATRRVRPGPYVELAITDTGTGMSPDIMARIFEPFFTTKDAGQGTGLGLAIVHGIVTQAGGALSVYSEPGQGSTFRVILPVAEGQIAAPEVEDRAVAPRTLPAIRILVVDDRNDVREVTARVLREAGCTVIEAGTAGEARKVVVSDEAPIDLAVIDIVLPDARGDLLAGQLRELRPSMAFILMSGYPAGALTPTGAPPENLLAKPFTPSELRAAVARACGARSSAPAAAAPEPTAAGKRRALVADDDEPIRRAIVRMLRRAGFDTIDVDSGYRAIAALESDAFDVVVSDVQMPDGGGLDLLRAVRRIDLDVPVILVTGQPSVSAAAAALEYGAFRYLTKPLDQGAFVKSVEHAARAHALARLRREASAVTGAHAGIADRAGLEVRFADALEQIWMAYQPIVHARTGAPFGLEALLRSSEASLPNPGALLDAATQLGRLPALGRKVRALSGTAIAARDDQTALFVNLHPEDLMDVDLVDEAAPLSAIAPRVILEVTERASLESSPRLTERIARLRQLGFRLAVDDIGAGYSGLTSFTELTPEIVKLDMSLVRDVHCSPLKQRTIGALCRLCHDVGTLVVGEGVETAEERDALVDLGCDLLQGYLIGKPKPL